MYFEGIIATQAKKYQCTLILIFVINIYESFTAISVCGACVLMLMSAKMQKTAPKLSLPLTVPSPQFILTHKDWFLDLLLAINSNEPDHTCDCISVSQGLRHDVLEMGEQPGLE